MADSASVRRVIDDLGISAPGLHVRGDVHLFRAGPGELLPLWRRLRAMHDKSGLWPLILGTDDDIAVLEDFSAPNAAAEVACGLALDATARLAELRAELEEDSGPDEIRPARGDATGLQPDDEDAFHLAEEPGWLGLVAAAAGYLVPGLLNWNGAANFGVEPSDHVAILRHWNDRYGAELAGLGLDVIELWVPRPPADPVAALALAEEQYWYCPDVVDQGVQTLDALAAVQVPSRRWFFWWD